MIERERALSLLSTQPFSLFSLFSFETNSELTRMKCQKKIISESLITQAFVQGSRWLMVDVPIWPPIKQKYRESMGRREYGAAKVTVLKTRTTHQRRS